MCDILQGYTDAESWPCAPGRQLLSSPQEGPAGLQKALKRFQRATLLDLSPSHFLTCASFSVSWNRRVDKHWVNYWDQIPTRKESISTFQAELGETLISNNDGSRQGEAVFGRSLKTWLTMAEHLGILQTDYFHSEWEKGAVRGSQYRPPSLPLNYLIFSLFFFPSW